MRTWMLAACFSLTLTACGTEPSASPAAQQHTGDIGSTSDIQAALAALPSAEVVGSHEDGVPFMIKGRLGAAQGLAAGSSLSNIAAVFRLQSSDLVLVRSDTDEQGNTHLRYRQTKNGLPVIGGELIVHQDVHGLISSANGSARDGESAPSKPLIASDAARLAALDATAGLRLQTQGEPRLVYVRSGQDNTLKLAYEVVVTGEGATQPIRDHVFINALTGSVEQRDSDVRAALYRSIKTWPNNIVVRVEGQPATGDAITDAIYDNLGEAYNCFKTVFNRDSYDDAGAPLIALSHYNNSNYTDVNWDGTQLLFTDGNGVDSLSCGLDKDSTTHELFHAVIERTSNLAYTGEPGGLNESIADIMASVCESWASGTWSTAVDIYKLGEDIWTPTISGDAYRYMDNPALDGISLDYWTSSAGSMDVHYSSGISNLAYALLSKGGTHPRGKSTTVVPALGVEKAGRIFYTANQVFFTTSTTFAQAKTYTEQAAAFLGYSTADVASVTAAWQAVGVGISNPLTNGVAKTGLSASTGKALYYYLDVPANKASTFTLSGGTGDADLYVRAGAIPTTSLYDCRPYQTGNAETCSIAAKTAAARLYVMVHAYSTYSGVSLVGSY
ncbi:M4 family metallopeptidase [Vitiosangium sp. GDMCC 1.1324]|uniref:M4 family metallopeptidase n=1 Tax=Vitiosangium sp. (strain GDMCC 1.1324) TaxID=2138576 RepID=UPI000D3C8FD3|nr:M4 family metallopeptidase [Vitiosangium sp. GDMCC 1.1324]PTL84467.1 peptidase M4 family protein [Vitiosangium sp. GDMCC 1.1324]